MGQEGHRPCGEDWGWGVPHQYRKQTPTKPDSGWPETRIQASVQDTDGGSWGPRACGLTVGLLAYRCKRAHTGRNTNFEEKDARLLV